MLNSAASLYLSLNAENSQNNPKARYADMIALSMWVKFRSSSTTPKNVRANHSGELPYPSAIGATANEARTRKYCFVFTGDAFLG